MVLVLAAVPATVLATVLFVVLGTVLVVALVPPELALARPPQAPSGAPPRPGLPSWTGPPSRPAGLARRLLLRRGCLARDGATAPALGGLAAGAAFDLWCAGGGENKGEKSAGGVEKGVHLQVYGSGLRNKFSGHIRQFSRAVRRARVGGGEGRSLLLCLLSSIGNNRRGGLVNTARDQQPITVPATAAHRARRLHLFGGLLATRRAAERRAEARGGPPDRPNAVPGRRWSGGVRRSAHRAFLGPPPTSRTLLSPLPDLSL